MLDELIQERMRKLHEYEKSKTAYPSRVKKAVSIFGVLENFSSLEKSRKKVTIHGRIFSWRDQGKIIFSKIIDSSGGIQAVFNKKNIKSFTEVKFFFDPGDFLEIEGTVFTTKRGEKSILAWSARIIAKSLRPLPFTWYGLENEEERLRKRYLDTLIRPEVREIFKKKEVFWDSIRDFLKLHGYMGVETPVLEPIPGGAEAEPFLTHHNSLNEDFYLRISLEISLKKLLVGGFERVFEIGRIFRNEGIDREHLQDYTQMECYAAYEDYIYMMKFVEEMYKNVMQKVWGRKTFVFQGKRVNWGAKWERVDYYKVFKKGTGVDLSSATKKELFKKARELRIPVKVAFGKSRLIDLLFKKTVRHKLIRPCFLIDPPVEVEPLAKRTDYDSGRVCRFQILAFGTELGKGFSELNDPRDQRKRFEEQMKLRESGDKEAQMINEDFLEALEYGMPPAGGFGMSERLFSVIEGKSVRETTIFPLMRKE